MSLQYDAKFLGDYILVTVTGQNDLEDLFHMMDAVKALAEQNQCRRLLVDMTGVEGPVDISFRFQVGKRLAQTFSGQTRLSIFLQDKPIDGFVELVALNRGAAIKVFQDQQAALKWLLEGS